MGGRWVRVAHAAAVESEIVAVLSWRMIGGRYKTSHIRMVSNSSLRLDLRFITYQPAMPSIQPGSKVLVTGGNGYIGAWVVHALLAEGFLVRAAVRSEDKAKPLREHLATLDHDQRVRDAVAKGALEFVYVPDFVKEGAFDGVMEGVEGILHLASPIAIPNGPADGECHLALLRLTISHRRLQRRFHPPSGQWHSQST